MDWFTSCAKAEARNVAALLVVKFAAACARRLRLSLDRLHMNARYKHYVTNQVAASRIYYHRAKWCSCGARTNTALLLE